jgi:hypothetical protein
LRCWRLQYEVRDNERRVDVRYVEPDMIADPWSDLTPAVEDDALTARVDRRWEAASSTFARYIPTDALPALADSVRDVGQRQQIFVQYP